ncbi:hypothetical protein TRVL_02010 [Trypanosoma vivax]|nr:hypothetical protein TRVL_02010 [Trypanosoma vivax]
MLGDVQPGMGRHYTACSNAQKRDDGFLPGAPHSLTTSVCVFGAHNGGGGGARLETERKRAQLTDKRLVSVCISRVARHLQAVKRENAKYVASLSADAAPTEMPNPKRAGQDDPAAADESFE